MKKRMYIQLILLGIVFLFSSCTLFNSPDQDEIPITVDPVFLELYEYLGGEEILGEPITHLYSEGDISYQYTQTCLMQFDPKQPQSQRYSLFPLSVLMEVYQAPPGDYYPQAEDLIVNGYAVHPAFVNLYQALMGEQFAGKPRTGPITNYESNRIEQYFENVAFYMDLDDPTLQSKLLPLGLMACDELCRSIYNSQEDPAANLPAPFAKAVNELGIDFLGQVISAPYTISDGSTELIFENMVLYSEPNSSKYHLRPIVGLLGYAADPPTAEVRNEYLVFVEIENDLGHNIPLFIYEFIQDHGGLDISGLPTTEFNLLGDDIFRQCFTNLCVEFHSNAPEPLQLVPSLLGRKYQQLVFGDEGFTQSLDHGQSDITPDLPIITTSDQLPDPLSGVDTAMILTSEKYPLISSDESQTIFITLYDEHIPIQDAVLYIEVFYPDETNSVYLLKPTDENGQTAIQLPAIPGSSGNLVEYKVCINLEDEGPVCVEENFLIWNP